MILTANHEDVFIHSGFDILIGYRKGVDKATALVSNIKRRAGMNVQHVLDLYPTAGKIIIGT